MIPSFDPDKIPRSSPSSSPPNGSASKPEEGRRTEAKPSADLKTADVTEEKEGMPVPQVKVSCLIGDESQSCCHGHRGE